MDVNPVRTIKVALISNCAAAVFKMITGALTGSTVLISEALHSLVGATNQAIHFYNSPSAGQASGHIYSYGHGPVSNLANLWASVGLFSIGAGMGLSWGFYRLIHRPESKSLAADVQGTLFTTDGLSLLAVLGALLIQSYSFTLAARLYLQKMRHDQARNPVTYLRHCTDISLSIIVAQSLAGLLGLLLAGMGIWLSLLARNPFWEALAAVLIAVLMGWVAFYLGYLYIRHMTDVRDRDAERALKQLLEENRTVHRSERIHSMILDNNSTVLFAEIELTQDAMVSGMLRSISIEKQALLRKLPADKQSDIQAQAFVTARSIVEAPLKRAGLIVADLEQQLREKVPQVAAVSIRVKGIGPFSPPAPTKLKDPLTQEAEYIGPDTA